MITERLRLGPESFVIEVACNDGYLLKNFMAAGIPPGHRADGEHGRSRRGAGIPVRREFFGEAFGRRLAGKDGWRI